jgi:iron complex transport system ATP-binding protein
VRLEIDGRVVLDDLSLRAARGEVLGIVGPNGAGKSSLLRCASGLARARRGAISWEGEDLGVLAPGIRARHVAFLPQGQEAAWPVTVEEAVALGRLPHGGGGRDADSRAVASALARAGVADLAHRRLDTLSGGERARALLARALAVEAPALLLDEPCAALDPRHRIAAMELFVRLAREGSCVCVVLHDLALAARHCDRIAVLDRGRLVALGKPVEALRDDVLARVYGVRAARAEIDGAPLILPWALVGQAEEPVS